MIIYRNVNSPKGYFFLQMFTNIFVSWPMHALVSKLKRKREKKEVFCAKSILKIILNYLWKIGKGKIYSHNNPIVFKLVFTLVVIESILF